MPPGGGQPLSLAHLGHMSPATYSWVTPGGCDQLSLTYFKPARVRSQALDPGRLVYAYRGGSIVWRGILDEPTVTGNGWNITAHGTGGWGTDYRAIYSVAWGTGVFNDAVDQAITRGLGWVRDTNIGAVANIWTGQQVDSASQTIVDLLNLGCSKGGLTWSVTADPRGNLLSVYALPTAPNRILIATAPASQSIAAGPDALYLRYQNSPDVSTTPATFATTSVVQQSLIDAQGRREDYSDLSSAGQLSAGSAQGVGNQVLKRFTRAGFTDPFTIRYGQLTNMGGTPVDPGVFYSDGLSAMVCQVILSDFAFSGEVTRGPVNLLMGSYQWDDGARVGTLTPFNSVRHDFGSLMQAALDAIPPRTQPIQKKKKGK